MDEGSNEESRQLRAYVLLPYFDKEGNFGVRIGEWRGNYKECIEYENSLLGLWKEIALQVVPHVLRKSLPPASKANLQRLFDNGDYITATVVAYKLRRLRRRAGALSVQAAGSA